MKVLHTCLLGLLALPLAGQTAPNPGNTGFSVGGSVILGLDSYKKAVNSSTGFMLNAAWDTPVYKSDIPARLSLAVGSMPGKELRGLKTSLTLVQLAGDILIPTQVTGLRGIFGLSLNKYSAKFSGEESPAAFDAEHHFPFRDTKGIKGGLRLGLEYAVSRRVVLEGLVQSTELSGRQRSDALIRQGAINPAWLQLGARYQF